MQAIWLVVVAAGSVVAAGDKNETEKGARQKLQGVWKLTELIEGGKKMPTKDATIEFKGDQLFLTFGGEKQKGTYTINPTKTPAWLDVTIERDGKRQTTKGIYEVKRDQMRFCHPNGETGERPTAFEATPQTVIAVLKKQKS
jgi:uncharacterized protein (TIGR03067 family)